MRSQVKQLYFTGKTIYCGIDVHKTSWKVCLLMEDRVLQRFSQPPSPEAMGKILKQQYPGATYKASYEAGFCGFHPQRMMTDSGIDCIIVNPSDIPTMDKEKHQKSDTVDCSKLARCLSVGSVNGIHIPSVQQQDDRCVSS